MLKIRLEQEIRGRGSGGGERQVRGRVRREISGIDRDRLEAEL